MPLKAKGGKKNRKIGRNEKWCEAYRARHQRERNKVVKLRRHLKKHPGDVVAARAVPRWSDPGASR